MKETDRVLRSLLAWDGTAALSVVLAVFVQRKRAQALLREQEARRQAEQAVRVRDHFVASASHDLRTPLATIVSRTGLLQGRLRRQQDLPAAWLADQLEAMGEVAPAMLETVEGAHIFRPFYRAATAQDVPGAGLGLASAKTIVERHRGQIRVASTLGVGTTVVVVLLPPGQRPAPPTGTRRVDPGGDGPAGPQRAGPRQGRDPAGACSHRVGVQARGGGGQGQMRAQSTMLKGRAR